ncbi:MAG: efflux transporter outer membrane subunit [Thiohalocapsa sp.]|jgi:NodT family efflux transporter outer membrane factor (OMF) lipoprotein
MRRAICTTVAVAAMLSGSGCMMIGPEYEEPAAPVESDWLDYEDPRLDATSPLAPEWWRAAFSDPALDRLIEIALADNLTLRSAGLRVLQARQQLAIAVGNQYPQEQELAGSAGVERAQGRSDDVYDFGFNVSWEADVWGRFRRQVETASALLDASLASYDGVTVSLIAQVAQSYLSIRTTERRLEVARYNVQLQEESVRISRAKFDAGAVSALDVEQALTLLHNTRAAVYSLEIALRQFTNALAVLLGRPPQDLGPLLGEPRPVPAVDPEIAVGMPQDLIRRRPDIRVAERQLAAQSAQIGFAITELYPQFSINGSIGTSVTTFGENDAGDLFTDDTFRYNLTGGFRWSLFNYGRLRSNVRLQDATFQQLLEDYRQTVLSVQAEVENSIVAFLRSREQLLDFRAAADAAQRSVEISTVQYEDGLVDFNTVLSTLDALASQQDQLATAEGSVAANLVDVYRSLGGGWETRTSADPADLIPEETRDEMRDRTKYWDGTFTE